jgi:hypothetical protein
VGLGYWTLTMLWLSGRLVRRPARRMDPSGEASIT